MNHTSEPKELKVSEVAVLITRPLFLAFSKEVARSIRKLFDCARKTLQAIIRGKVDPESIIHSDCLARLQWFG